MAGPDTELRIVQIRTALEEDLGSGDLTATLVPKDAIVQAEVLVRERAVLCGIAWFDGVFQQLDSSIEIDWQAGDGDRLTIGQTVCAIRGPARSILSGERTALNFLQTLSGTATRAAAYVDAVAGTNATILDTRKTLPGLRLAQKYAVRCGGASNHRIGLYDAILIKENHIRAAGSITTALKNAVAASDTGVMVEIEVEDLDQLAEALDAGAQRVLLDNFDLGMLRDAVAQNAGLADLEASGGVDMTTVRAIAETGVDFISVGELTKDLRATDFSMQFAVV